MISVEEARGKILAALHPTPAEIVALAEAWNRVTATPVLARLTQPPADVSAMDGYAVRAADGTLGAMLRVIGAAPAGHPFEGSGVAGRTMHNPWPALADARMWRVSQHAGAGAGCAGGGRGIQVGQRTPTRSPCTRRHLAEHTEQALLAVGLNKAETVGLRADDGTV
jgi:hypothetical protein